jgi:hypothetical protein
MKIDRLHYILDGRNVVTVDLDTWARWFETSNRVVKQEHIGPYFVSTVFLGINHRFVGNGPPLIFETMVFHPSASTLGAEMECERCSTYDEAEEQHERIAKKYRDSEKAILN